MMTDRFKLKTEPSFDIGSVELKVKAVIFIMKILTKGECFHNRG